MRWIGRGGEGKEREGWYGGCGCRGRGRGIASDVALD